MAVTPAGIHLLKTQRLLLLDEPTFGRCVHRAQGIQQAERVAIALAARAFDGSWNRTFSRDIDAGKRDLAISLSCLPSMRVSWLFLLFSAASNGG